MTEITAVKDDGGTESHEEATKPSDPARQPSDVAIRWCADRGYALDEADQAWVRDVWGRREGAV